MGQTLKSSHSSEFVTIRRHKCLKSGLDFYRIEAQSPWLIPLKMKCESAPTPKPLNATCMGFVVAKDQHIT